MSEVQCPYCGSDRVVTERRRRSPQSSSVKNSVGQWRIGCGVTLTIIAVLFGAFSLLARSYWLGVDFDSAALQIALFAFIFAAIALAMTLFFSRWVPFERHTCRQCERVWVSEVPQNEITQVENSA
jgi:uncharacterized membrane protein